MIISATALPIISAFVLPSVMLLFTQFVRRPGWYKSVKWGKINTIAFIGSIVLALSAVFMTSQANMHYITSLMLTSAIALIGYVFLQGLTDVYVRKADRGTLHMAFGLMLPISLLYYIYHLDFLGWYEFGGFLVATFLGFFLLYMPGFGASDGRAVQLAIVAGFPAIGVVGVATAMLFYAVGGAAFVAYIVFKYKVSSLTYINNLSVPAVPIVLFPFVLLTLYAIADLAYNLDWLIIW